MAKFSLSESALEVFPFPPLFQPITDLKNGIATPHWVTYFTDLSNRVKHATLALEEPPADPGTPTVPDAPPPAPPIVSLIFANRGLKVRDQGPTYNLTLQPLGVYTAFRTLGFALGNVDRTITFLGNPTLDDWFDQCVKTTCSPSFANLTVPGTIDVENLTVNGFPITVTGPVTLPPVTTLPPFIAFTNVANPWSALQTFSSLAITPGNFLVGGKTVTVTANVSLPQTLTLPPNVAFTNVNNNFSIVQSFQAGIVMGTNQLYVNGFQLSVLGNSIVNQDVSTVGSPIFSAVNINKAGVAALTCSNITDGVAAVFHAHVPSFGLLMGTTTNHPITIYTNNASRMTLNAAGNTLSFPGGTFLPLSVDSASACIGRDFLWATSRLYVQGFRVTVTADCTIPSTGGGGATLPPTLAYYDTSNPWSIQQNFGYGISVGGHTLTMTGAAALDQDVRTTASPTFQNMLVNSAFTVGGNMSSPRYDSGGKTGKTISGTVNGILLEFTGGVCTHWGP